MSKPETANSTIASWLLGLAVVSWLAVPLLLFNWSKSPEFGPFSLTLNKLLTALLPLSIGLLAGLVWRAKRIHNQLPRWLQDKQAWVGVSLVIVFIVSFVLLCMAAATQNSPNYYYFLNLRPLAIYLMVVSLFTLVYIRHILLGKFSFSAAVTILMTLGVIIRVLHLTYIDVGLPYSLGGLFVEFSKQIVAHQFKLPDFIPVYAGGQLPFAYPPLAFYFQALLFKIAPNLNIFVVANILPAVLTLGTLPLIYLLVKNLYPQRPGLQLGILVAFCFFPAAFYEQKDSAGLAEALGMIALLIFYLAAHRFWRSSAIRQATGLAFALALCVLSSPGSGYLAGILSVGLLGLALWSRSVQKTSLLALTGLLAVVLTAPYWATVLHTHGVGIFLDSIGHQNQGGFLEMLIHNFRGLAFVYSNRPYLWGGLVLAGVVLSLLRRDLLWPLLLIVSLGIPSEGIWMASISSTVLAGMAIYWLFEQVARTKVDSHCAFAAAMASLTLITYYGVLDALDPIRFYNRDYWKNAVTLLETAASILPANASTIGFDLPTQDIFEWAPLITRFPALDLTYGTEWDMEARQKALHYMAAGSCDSLVCIQGILASGPGTPPPDPETVYVFTTGEELSRLANNGSMPHEVVYTLNELVIFRFP